MSSSPVSQPGRGTSSDLARVPRYRPSLSARAAVTAHRRRDDLTTEMRFLTFVRAEVQEQGVGRCGFCRGLSCFSESHPLAVSSRGLSRTCAPPPRVSREQRSPFWKDMGRTGFGPHSWPPFTWVTSFKSLVFKYSHILRYWGWGLASEFCWGT